MRYPFPFLFLQKNFSTAVTAAMAILIICPHSSANGIQGKLEFKDGYYTSGDLLKSEKDGELRFLSSGFTEPLIYSMAGSIIFKPHRIDHRNDGVTPSRRIMLRNSDYLDGDLVDIKEDLIVWKSDVVGILEIPRKEVAQVFFPKTQSSIFFGPRDVSDWQVKSGSSQDWSFEGGSLATTAPNTSIFKNFPSLTQVQIHLKLSWKKRGDFLVAIGTSDLEADIASAYRLETWSGELVAQRETSDDIDLFSISSLQDGASELELKIKLDQATGELETLDANGQLLGSLKVPSPENMFNHGVLIKNKGGDLSIDRLNIIPIDLNLESDSKLAGGFLINTEGELTSLAELAWDKNSASFTKPSGTVDEDTISETKVELVENEDEQPGEVSDVEDSQTSNLVVPDEIIPIEGLQLIHFNSFYDELKEADSIDCHGSARFSGDVQRINTEDVSMNPSWVSSTISIPFNDLTRINFNPKGGENEESPWILNISQETRLSGDVTGVKFVGKNKYPALVWKPQFSEVSVPLTPGLKAFLYPKKKAKPNLLNKIVKNNILQINSKLYPNLLLIKTGEIVPCNILEVNDETVKVLTFFNSEATIPLSLIRSLELSNKPLPKYFSSSSNKPNMNQGFRRMPIPSFKNSITQKQKENLDKFLTLTRSRKYLPPTHIIRAVNGDLIKADFVSLDASHVTFELNEIERKIPRDRVASISPIELNSESLEKSSPDEPAKPDEQDGGQVADALEIIPGTVQLKMENDYYINVLPENFKEGKLFGQSKTLGECSIPALMVSSIALRPETKTSRNKWPHLDWQMVHAKEPVAAAVKSQDPGRQAPDPLVGMDATDFTLENLSGQNTSLSNFSNKIVVLDFWASWCGPCMTAMPGIIETVNKFEQEDVKLIGVNVQEDKTTAARTVKGRNFDMEVVLDTTGKISMAYNAGSIPRTVVVGKDGKIKWAHTGASPTLGDQLENVINALQKGIPLDQASAPGLGQDVPDFSTRLVSGKPLQLSDLKGKVTVLDFWASWCAPCIQAMPELISAVEGFDKDKVQLVGINQGQSAQIISNFMKRKEWEFDVALDLDQSIGAKFGVSSIPHTIILDQQGKVAHIQIGYRPGLDDSFSRIIKNLLESE